MKEIIFKLNIDEINLALTALGNMPYIQVHDLINKIQIQAKTQLKDNESARQERVVMIK
jgi:hypothetical protein